MTRHIRREQALAKTQFDTSRTEWALPCSRRSNASFFDELSRINDRGPVGSPVGEPPLGSTVTANVAFSSESPAGSGILIASLATTPIDFGALPWSIYQSSRLFAGWGFDCNRAHEHIAGAKIHANDERWLIAAAIDHRNI